MFERTGPGRDCRSSDSVKTPSSVRSSTSFCPVRKNRFHCKTVPCITMTPNYTIQCHAGHELQHQDLGAPADDRASALHRTLIDGGASSHWRREISYQLSVQGERRLTGTCVGASRECSPPRSTPRPARALGLVGGAHLDPKSLSFEPQEDVVPCAHAKIARTRPGDGARTRIVPARVPRCALGRGQRCTHTGSGRRNACQRGASSAGHLTGGRGTLGARSSRRRAQGRASSGVGEQVGPIGCAVGTA